MRQGVLDFYSELNFFVSSIFVQVRKLQFVYEWRIKTLE